jgi:hypothetical protein
MFRNIFIALAAVALLALGASGVNPTTAFAYDDEHREYCEHHPYDPSCWSFYHHRDAEENEHHEQEHHDQDTEDHDQNKEHHDQDHEHHDQDHEQGHHDQDKEHHDQDHEHEHPNQE